MPARLDLIGQKFDRLIVIRTFGHRKKKVIWLCKCQCGRYSHAQTSDLTSGKHRSCGCLHIDTITKHGATSYKERVKLLEYHSWQTMKDRCLNPNSTGFNRYGGRGIKICTRWIDSFTNFLEDLGLRPTPKHTLDRKDNNGNYSPDNCRWITRKEQAQNRAITELVKTSHLKRQRNSNGQFC